MATDLLVRDRIDAGMRLLQLLRANRFPVSAAYWLRGAESESWKLVIATERAAHAYRDSYLNIATWMNTDDMLRRPSDIDGLRLEDISLVKPSDKLAQAIMKLERQSSRTVIHLKSTLLGDQYVDEAIVYKLDT